jgi:hypothetical protein
MPHKPQRISDLLTGHFQTNDDVIAAYYMSSLLIKHSVLAAIIIHKPYKIACGQYSFTNACSDLTRTALQKSRIKFNYRRIPVER